jgi:hypothetical protein
MCNLIENFMFKNNKLTTVIITLLLVSSSALKVHAQIGLPGGGTDPDDLPYKPDSVVSANYDHTSFYYMPNIKVYYDILAHEYIYTSNKVWVHKSTLPSRYHQYNIYHSYKVKVNQRCPWLRDEELAARYARRRKY